MDKVETIKTEAESLLGKMITKYEIEVLDEEGVYQVVIKTDEEASTVIGRHGETIRAIQKILEVIFYKTFGEAVNILVNVNDYREKQRERLEAMAGEYATQALNSQEPVELRGLSSYERKLVHEYVTKNHPELTTESVGEGKDRRLMIQVKK